MSNKELILILVLHALLHSGYVQERNMAVVTLQPYWPLVFAGETITLRCVIINGRDAEWEYEWKTTSLIKPPKTKVYRITVLAFHKGSYQCIGRNKTEQESPTEWSNPFTLRVNMFIPRPVLTASPLWPSPGDSVTLNCSVEHPSAGWRFSWYKAVPKPAERSYGRMLLPDSTTGTEQNSYTIHAPTHTAGYVCRAARGEPAFSTLESSYLFVWSGDFESAVSLTVSPNTALYFFSQSVSLTCQGKSTDWRVMRFTEIGYLSHCTGWGTMIGSKCIIPSLAESGAVYWCESGSGEYSNAVNITVLSSKPESSSCLLLLLTGVLTGALLVILQILLYRFIKSMVPCSDRPTESQSPSEDERVRKDETQERVYSSLLKGDDCIYESIGGCGGTGNDGQAEEHTDATFHVNQLKG